MRKQILFIASLLVCIVMTAQNKLEEVIPYEEIDGFIVIPAQIKGKEYKFIFDPLAHSAMLEEYVAETGFLRNDIPVPFPRTEIESVSGGSIVNLCIGVSIFVQKTGGIIIKSDYLKNRGIAGVLNAAPFGGYVLTINSKRKTLTLSTPYKPSYVNLQNRTSLANKAQSLSININGRIVNVNLDLAGGGQLVTLSETDFASLQSGLSGVADNVPISRMLAYKQADMAATEAIASNITIANIDFADTPIYAVKGDNASTIGAGILKKGILSLDYVKGRLFFQPFDTVDESKIPETVTVANTENTEGDVINLTRFNFAQHVFDYRTQSGWEYVGEKPAIIDFWAPWCGPCKRISSTLENLARQYKDEIIVYKLNIDDEPDLAKYFDAKAIPLLLYIPMEGEPVRAVGALPQETIVEKIREILLVAPKRQK